MFIGEIKEVRGSVQAAEVATAKICLSPFVRRYWNATQLHISSEEL